MAKKANRFFKRALSLAEQKWDSSKGESKDGSGTTVDEVVFFVRQGMYHYINRSKGG